MTNTYFPNATRGCGPWSIEYYQETCFKWVDLVFPVPGYKGPEYRTWTWMVVDRLGWTRRFTHDILVS